MSIMDEFKTATDSLDRILAKLENAPASDKAKLEAAAKAAQAKVQGILAAIQKLR
jgi:hypothetical protein